MRPSNFGEIVKAVPNAPLPKRFVSSMKTLFDILGNENNGLVKLSDIEKGWLIDGNHGVPNGVIESLRKVTLPNGLLTFDRFCTGLKICLRNRNKRGNTTHQIHDSISSFRTIYQKAATSQPTSLINQGIDMSSTWSSKDDVLPKSATQSLCYRGSPQLYTCSDTEVESDAAAEVHTETSGPPPKPPRSALPIPLKAVVNKVEIRNAPQNWQMGLKMDGIDIKNKKYSLPIMLTNRLSSRGAADGGSATDTSNQSKFIFQKKKITKKREPRRHTLQNGIDNKLLKRLKLFEAEKDILLQGLSAVEQARDWYLQQIGTVQEKIKFLAHSTSHVEQWSEAYQERVDFQRARIIEINRHLSALRFSWERGGFPSHMNLAAHINHRIQHQSLKQENLSLN